MRLSKTLFALSLSIATPTLADPTLGLGLSLSFGAGSPQTGIGLRVFSDDAADSIVGSVGVDYMLNSQSWRGTLGGAYLGSNAYVGLDMGLGFGGGGVDFGLSAGAVNSSNPSGPKIGDVNQDGGIWDGEKWV